MDNIAKVTFPFIFGVVLMAARPSSSLQLWGLIEDQIEVMRSEISSLELDLALVEGKMHVARGGESPERVSVADERQRISIESAIDRTLRRLRRFERVRDEKAVDIGIPVILGTVVSGEENNPELGPPSQTAFVLGLVEASDVRLRIHECYAAELVENPFFTGGRIVVKVVVSPDGSSTTSVKSSTMGAPRVEECVAVAVSVMLFPEHAVSEMVIMSLPIALD